VTPDPRHTLARPDLAAAWLEGVTPASRYAAATAWRTKGPAVAILASGDPMAAQVDQLLFGEAFDVIEVSRGFAWGQARRNGYVGFVEAEALSPDVFAPTHWVSAPSTFAFAEPSIKSRPFGPLSLNALVEIEAEDDRLALARGAGWIAKIHLRPIGRVFEDPASVAEGFVGVPYLWGGRTCVGLDCSGLVQQALFACGRGCPRDTDQQAGLGVAVRGTDLRRGDLVFWPGHVGMMLDADRLIHANAHHMAVAVEPLAAAADRIARTATGEPTAFRRPL
jgi:cell wall-associated NlpC family hydrolase